MSRVILYEFAVNEARTLIKYVVKRLDIKYVSDLAWVIFFNFVFDYKCHVAERKCQIFFENEPVVIFPIESVSLFNVKTIFVDTRNLRLKVFVYEGLDRAPFVWEVDLLLCDNVWITQLVPDDAVIVFDVIVLDFAVLGNIPNDDRVRITRLFQNYNNGRRITAASYTLDSRLNVAVFYFKRDLMEVVLSELLVQFEIVDVLFVPLEKVMGI